MDVSANKEGNDLDDTRTEYDVTEDEYDPSDIAVSLKAQKGETSDLTCYVCGNTWVSKNNKLPKRCSKCRSTRWNNPDIIHNDCKRCGHRWISETRTPTKCPRCQSYKWNESAQQYKLTCKRCSHEWNAKRFDPVRCPKCKSAKWNEYRREYHCPKCNRSHIIKVNSRPGVCPSCDPYTIFHRCAVCGNSWKKVRGHAMNECPSCHSKKWCDIEDTVKKETDMERSRIRMMNILQDMERDDDADVLADILGIEIYKAGIYITYMRGENPVRISIDLGLSFEHVMNVIGNVDAVIKRY